MRALAFAQLVDPSVYREDKIGPGRTAGHAILVADEVVGCLAQAHMIDTNRIHSMGMSAGALQTTAIGFIRASYIASVATYSGGVPPGFMPTNQDPENKFAALIFDGGTSDNVYSVDFQAASKSYKAMLEADGHFAAICDHGMGHAIPLDAAPSVAAFFTATVRAPITGIVLATELTGVTNQLPPTLGACAVAMLVAMMLRCTPIYDALTTRAAAAAQQNADEAPAHYNPLPPSG